MADSTLYIEKLFGIKEMTKIEFRFPSRTEFTKSRKVSVKFVACKFFMCITHLLNGGNSIDPCAAAKAQNSDKIWR